MRCNSGLAREARTQRKKVTDRRVFGAILLLAAAMVTAAAQTRDRVYTADQTSKTVSVIDPSTNKLLGSIHLGEDVPAAFVPSSFTSEI